MVIRTGGACGYRDLKGGHHTAPDEMTLNSAAAEVGGGNEGADPKRPRRWIGQTWDVIGHGM